MKKQPEITDATRNRILEAFWVLFKELPVEKITVGRLAKEAGIHRSSFYRYYSDIYLVLDEFQTNLFTHLKSESIDKMDFSNVTNLSLMTYIQNTSVLLTKEADKIYRLINCNVSTFREKLINEFQKNIVRLPIPEKFDREYIITMVTTMMMTNFIYWYEHQEKYTLQDINLMGFKLFGKSLLSAES